MLLSRSLRVIAVPLITIAFLGAGCSGEDTSTPPPSAAQETEGPPQLPIPSPRDSTNDEDAAAAFVEYFVDVFNYAAATGDTKLYRTLYTAECDGCESYAKTFEDQASKGQYFPGTLWTFSDKAEVFKTSEEELVVELSVKSLASEGDVGIQIRMTQLAPQKVTALKRTTGEE